MIWHPEVEVGGRNMLEKFRLRSATMVQAQAARFSVRAESA